MFQKGFFSSQFFIFLDFFHGLQRYVYASLHDAALRFLNCNSLHREKPQNGVFSWQIRLLFSAGVIIIRVAIMAKSFQFLPSHNKYSWRFTDEKTKTKL
jgi:hypothetical protein